MQIEIGSSNITIRLGESNLLMHSQSGLSCLLCRHSFAIWMRTLAGKCQPHGCSC